MKLRMRRWSYDSSGCDLSVCDCNRDYAGRGKPATTKSKFVAATTALNHDRPSILRFAAWSVPEAAKSSKVVAAAWMMWRAMKGAPSAAPCSALLMQHSHSRTAHPGKSYCVNLEKMAAKSTWPSPRERKRPARLIQD